MEPYLGTWRGVSMVTGGVSLDPAKLNIDMRLTLKADGTGELVYIIPDGGKTWTMTNGQMYYGEARLTLEENGRLRYQMTDSEYMLFERGY